MNVSRTYRKGTVSWEPYSPLPGDSVTVRFDRSDSALRPDSAVVSVTVIDSTRTPVSRTQLHRSSGYDDVWTGRVGIPVGFERLFLVFDAGSDEHDGTEGWKGHDVLPLTESETAVCGTAVDGQNLLIDMCGRIVEDRLVLQYECADPEKSWIDSPDRPIRDGPGSCRLRFPLSDRAGAVRIVTREPAEDRVLFFMRLGPDLHVGRLACGLPYPNPTSAEIHYRVEVDAPTMASLRVYDVTGRLVHGPLVNAIVRGGSSLQWSASDLSAGVYFMRVTAGGKFAVRRVLIMSGR